MTLVMWDRSYPKNQTKPSRPDGAWMTWERPRAAGAAM
jgi:hypothetical protein